MNDVRAVWELSLTVITFKQGSSFMCQTKGPLPIPLKKIDVVRRRIRHWTCCSKVASTTLGTLMVAGSYQDCGPVLPSSQHLTKSLQMVTRGLVWRLTKVQATSRPDCLWPEVWSNIMSKRSQNKEERI